MPRKENKIMARIPIVSRTITTTDASVMCVNIITGETETKTFTVPRTYKDNDKLLKVVKQLAETDELKPVHIVNVEVHETLYGMTEAEFIEHAKVLPPRAQGTPTPAKKSKK